MISNYSVIVKTNQTDISAMLLSNEQTYTNSVGVKFVYNNKMYGSFVKLDHEPSAEEVSTIATTLTNDILKDLKNGEKE